MTGPTGVNDGCCLGINDTRRESQQRPGRSVGAGDGADRLLLCPALSPLIKRSGAFNPNMSSHNNNNNTRASEAAGLHTMGCEEFLDDEKDQPHHVRECVIVKITFWNAKIYDIIQCYMWKYMILIHFLMEYPWCDYFKLESSLAISNLHLLVSDCLIFVALNHKCLFCQWCWMRALKHLPSCCWLLNKYVVRWGLMLTFSSSWCKARSGSVCVTSCMSCQCSELLPCWNWDNNLIKKKLIRFLPHFRIVKFLFFLL